jgi:hypothetical protein
MTKSKINILNREFDFIVVDGKLFDGEDKQELGGLTNHDGRWIKISGTISQQSRDESVTHELMHDVLDLTSANHWVNEIDVELICDAAKCLIACLKDNGFIPAKFTLPKGRAK